MRKTTARTALEQVGDELKDLDTAGGFHDAVAALRAIRTDISERTAMREISIRRENLHARVKAANRS
jgi:hypothetical protein